MPQPETPVDRPTLMPYLLVDDVDGLVSFCESVFGAELDGRLVRPDGSVMHVEVAIGSSRIMMGSPMGEFEATPGMIFINVEDADLTFERAVEAGALPIMDVTTMRHAGERYGGVRDAFGNVWWISTFVEDVPWDEQQRRINDLVNQGLGQ